MTGGNIYVDAPGTLTLNGEVTSNATLYTAMITNGPTTYTVNGPTGNPTTPGNLDLGNAPRTFTVTASAPVTNSLDITANIVNASGALSLTKAGTGNLVLSGNNTYSGGSYINAGFIGIGSNTALGTGTVYSGASDYLVVGGPQTLSNNFIVTAFALGTAGTGGLADANPLTLKRPRQPGRPPPRLPSPILRISRSAAASETTSPAPL